MDRFFVVSVKLFHFEMNRDKFSGFSGSNSAQISIYGVRFLRDPTSWGASPYHEGRLPLPQGEFITICYTPGPGVLRAPLLGGGGGLVMGTSWKINMYFN